MSDDVRGHFPYHEYPHPSDHDHRPVPDPVTPLTAAQVVPFLRSVVASGERLSASDVDALADALAHPSDAAGLVESMDIDQAMPGETLTVRDRAVFARARRVAVERIRSAHPSDAVAFDCGWCGGDGHGDHAVDCAKRTTHPLDPRYPSDAAGEGPLREAIRLLVEMWDARYTSQMEHHAAMSSAIDDARHIVDGTQPSGSHDDVSILRLFRMGLIAPVSARATRDGTALDVCSCGHERHADFCRQWVPVTVRGCDCAARLSEPTDST